MDTLRRQVRDAVAEVQAALRERSEQYGQLAALTGEFDHSNMNDAEFAAHGLQRLGHQAPQDGDDAPTALRYVLAERSRGTRAAGDQQIPGNRLVGGNRVAMPGNRLLGQGQDADDAGLLTRYLRGED